jgi:hypothetical protein
MSVMITGPSPTDPEERSVDINGTVVDRCCSPERARVMVRVPEA